MGAIDVDALREENERLRQRVAELEARVEDRSMSFLRAAVEAAPVFIVGADADDRIRYLNRTARGRPPEEVLGTSIHDYVAGASAEATRAAMAEARRNGRAISYEVSASAADGRTSYYECIAAPLPELDDGGVCIVALDVTEQRRRDAAFRESEEKLRIALGAAHVGLWSIDVDRDEVFWNEHMHTLLGREEVIGPDGYLDLVHPDDRAAVRDAIERSFETREFSGPLHRVVRPDGAIRWVVTAGRIVNGEDGRVARVVGTHLDVTAQRETEEQLRQAQKLDAVGRLTAGVAHNFNNMLAAILPTLELVRPRANERDQKLIDDALHAGRRAAEMVRQLMTFAGQTRDGSWAPQDPRRLVDSALSICRRTFDRHIALEARVDGRFPTLLGDGGALEQVLVNMLLNARDAVKDVEAPRIAVELDLADARALSPPPYAKAPRYLRIRVRDDGVGMPPEVQRRVFEPFFTTKDVGAGTGLGLATSYTIVREHGGWIDVDSAPGRGTTFSVLLPVRAEPVHRVSPAEREPTAPPLPGARVLLVDDEDAVRRVVQRLLRKMGHEVETVPDGRRAVETLETNGAIDVVLLDRSMPEGPGDQYLERIREARPEVKVLLFTGHDVEPEARKRYDGVLPKPATRAELEAAIAAVLATRG